MDYLHDKLHPSTSMHALTPTAVQARVTSPWCGGENRGGVS